MKTLLISASPRKEKSSSFLLAREVAVGLAEEGIACETLHLDDYRFLFCKSCEACHKKILACPLKDDAMALLQKMLGADGILLASPNYINQVTGSLKVFFDRSAHFIHCLRLLGKYVAGVVTSGSGYGDPVIDYIGYYGSACGAQFSGGVSASRWYGKEKKEEAFLLGQKFAKDIREKTVYPDQMKCIEEHKAHFAAIMKMRKDDWIEEYGYWIGKGWL